VLLTAFWHRAARRLTQSLEKKILTTIASPERKPGTPNSNKSSRTSAVFTQRLRREQRIGLGADFFIQI